MESEKLMQSRHNCPQRSVWIWSIIPTCAASHWWQLRIADRKKLYHHAVKGGSTWTAPYIRWHLHTHGSDEHVGFMISLPYLDPDVCSCATELRPQLGRSYSTETLHWSQQRPNHKRKQQNLRHWWKSTYGRWSPNPRINCPYFLENIHLTYFWKI